MEPWLLHLFAYNGWVRSPPLMMLCWLNLTHLISPSFIFICRCYQLWKKFLKQIRKTRQFTVIFIWWLFAFFKQLHKNFSQNSSYIIFDISFLVLDILSVSPLESSTKLFHIITLLPFEEFNRFMFFVDYKIIVGVINSIFLFIVLKNISFFFGGGQIHMEFSQIDWSILDRKSSPQDVKCWFRRE